VNLERIAAEIRSPRTLESDARRYFLNEVVIGQDVFVDPVGWDARATAEGLRPGDYIGLGFDGSRSDDSTALIAVRREDLTIHELGIWEKTGDDWVIPRAEVHERVRDTFAAYRVGRMLGDPWKWENDLSLWAAEFGDVVMEFPTNVQVRMDRAIHRFMGAFRRGELTHTGAERLSRHMKSAVVVAGDRKKDRDEDDPHSTHYRKLSKRPGEKIDGAVAANLALEAAMTMPEAAEPVSPFVVFA
jgi:phage terminase large subunit-like protein